jgi:hypothetical protein
MLLIARILKTDQTSLRLVQQRDCGARFEANLDDARPSRYASVPGPFYIGLAAEGQNDGADSDIVRVKCGAIPSSALRAAVGIGSCTTKMDVLPERVVRRVNARCIGKYDTPQSTKFGSISGDFYELGIAASLIGAVYGPPFRRDLRDVEINASPKISTARSGLPRGQPHSANHGGGVVGIGSMKKNHGSIRPSNTVGIGKVDHLNFRSSYFIPPLLTPRHGPHPSAYGLIQLQNDRMR